MMISLSVTSPRMAQTRCGWGVITEQWTGEGKLYLCT